MVNKKPIVMQLTQYLGMGGLERVILNLAKGMQAAGRATPLVVVYDSVEGAPTLHDDFRAAGIEVIDMKKPPGVSLKIAMKIALVALRKRVRVIHSHDLSALIYAVFAKWFTLGLVRVVHTQHSFVHINNGPYYKLYERFFTWWADVVSAVSPALREQYGTVGVSPEKVVVVANGMEFPEAPLLEPSELKALRKRLIAEMTDREAARKLEERLDWVWLLCMARIHPGKGQDQVLDLWNELQTQEKVVLIYLGQETSTGELAKLRGKISHARDSGNVLYAGFTKKPGDWRQASQIFLSGSEFEGMPLGPIEAIGGGVEVLVSDIPGHSMLEGQVKRFDLKDKKQGAATLAKMIIEVARDFSGMRARSWETGRGVRETYGIAGMTESYAKYYRL